MPTPPPPVIAPTPPANDFNPFGDDPFGSNNFNMGSSEPPAAATGNDDDDFGDFGDFDGGSATPMPQN